MANPTTNYGFVLPTSTDLVTDLPADFDVALQGVDTRLKALQPGTTLGDLAYSSATANTNTRLPIGTSGQVLAVSGGGVPAWTTTADVTPLTTKGDLFTFTTVDARIGVGANGTVLTADSAEATGLKWATAGGGTESYTEVYNASLPAAASVTVSSLTGDKIRVYISSASSTNASATYRLKPNSNSTAANYNKGLTGLQVSQAGNATYPTYTAGSGNGFDLANGGNADSDSVIIYFEIDACKSTGIKTIRSYSWVSGTGGYGWITGGIYQQAAAVTSIQITCSTGNFDAGTITVWESAV